MTARGGVLASYSFDDDDIATGPDTFAIFEHAKGHVDLVSDVRHSGYSSVRITDVAGDGDFPEVQGYFRTVEQGTLRFQFAIFVATPREPFNIALAGPQHFTMEKDGIAFWLKSKDGFLCHVSDGIPKKLFAIEPFVWYSIDATLDIADGTYDLTITKENRNGPIVELKKQPNATQSPGSSVWMFSFVGSVFEDDSNVRYYIDDVTVTSSAAGTPPPYVAPGRRKLFIDRWREMQKAASTRKDCPPVIDFADVGGSARDVVAARSRIAELNALCARIASGDAAGALAALDAEPNATSFRLASIIALTRLDRWREAESRWSELAPLLTRDIRYGMIAALLGSHRRNWDEAEAWLREPAESLRSVDQELERKLIADEYYFVLLWRGENDRAARYAERVAARLDSSWWRERAGDALLLANRLTEARRFYEACSGDNSWSATEKLADIAYLQHDAVEERRLREKLYGSLHRTL